MIDAPRQAGCVVVSQNQAWLGQIVGENLLELKSDSSEL